MAFWIDLLVLAVVTGICVEAAPDIPDILWGITLMLIVLVACARDVHRRDRNRCG